MNRLLLALPLVLIAGCAGQMRDYIGPRSTIVTPQLIRYGLDLPQARCLGERLGSSLKPRQLRLFARAAGAVKQGWSEPGRLTMPDLLHVAGYDPKVRLELARAGDACGVTRTIAVHADMPAPPAPAPAAPAASAPVALTSAWLNLGAAGSGQSIAVDAATIEQEGATRTAWFRLTNPGAAAPTGLSYRLRIDCAAKTIRSLAQRRADAGGGAGEHREYGPPESDPLPVEGGTVMEIAYLSLCT
jgi:hypothetical protein